MAACSPRAFSLPNQCKRKANIFKNKISSEPPLFRIVPSSPLRPLKRGLSFNDLNSLSYINVDRGNSSASLICITLIWSTFFKSLRMIMIFLTVMRNHNHYYITSSAKPFSISFFYSFFASLHLEHAYGRFEQLY